MNASRFSILAVLLLCLFSVSVKSNANSVSPSAKIIIVLDDVGYRRTDIEAFNLPVEVAFSILPKTPHGTAYANLAHQQGRDVMLHLPMASNLEADLGPSALLGGMFRQDIENTLNEALLSVPYAIGVNNHMGSQLTTQTDDMTNLMLSLKQRSLFFLDSLTSPHSIAYETARKLGVPSDKRHIFLDHQQSAVFYQQQFDRLIRIAKKHGRAIGIAHPYPTSLAFLEEALKKLDEQGVELYPVSEYFSSSADEQRYYPLKTQ